MADASPSASDRVAVAIVSFDECELLARCLRSLEPDHLTGRAEVWVVDNASRDGSPEMVRRDFPWANLIANDENVGYGTAVNQVAQRTDAPFIAPSNQDIEVDEGALQALTSRVRSQNALGVAAPRLVDPEGATQHSVHPFPTAGVTLLFNLGLHRLSAGLADRLCLEGFWNPQHPREVPWAEAAFLVVRRDAFDRIGGFDPQMWLHAEDVDLAWRLAERGWRTFYEPAAIVHHAGSASTRKAFGDRVEARWMAASYAWIARRRGTVAARVIALLNFTGAAVRYTALGPAARLRPGRYGPAREIQGRWARIHLRALRPGALSEPPAPTAR